jgi:alanyl aminopeptidase
MMSRYLFATLLTGFWLTGCGGVLAPVNPIAAQQAPVGKLPDVARPVSYGVALKIDPRQEIFTGTVAMEVRLDEASDGLWIHGDDIRVEAVSVEGNAATYEEVLPTGVSRISFGQTYPAGQVKVTIDYEADFDVNLAGLFRVEEQGEAYALAKSESIQARRFLPGFDEPGYKAPFDITLIVPAGDEAISNTPIISRAPYADDNAFEQVVFDTTRPLSTYLLSVAVGPFDVVEYPDMPANSVRDVPIPLRGFARKGRGDDLKASLDITADMVAAFEQAVKLPYPYKKLDIIAAPQWPSGATELAAAITYRESRVLIDDNSGPAARRGMLAIHSHEIAHMWFGNLVTPPWWDDLWLKEAFATWGTPMVLSQLEPDAGHEIDGTVRAIGTMGLDSLASTRAVREDIDRNEDIRNAYDGITYSKGMAVISMADAYFGADVFRPALGKYLKAFEDTEADSPDFYRVIGDATGEPAMTEVFRSFIEQKGVPLLSVSAGDNDKLTLRQSRYRPLGSAIEAGTSWVIPVCVKFGRPDGSSDRVCNIMRDKTMDIGAGEAATYMMPNADGGGYYRWNLSAPAWEKLTENFDQLTPSEALSAVDSAAAAFRAGEGDAQTLLAVLKAAAAHSDRRVVVAPMAVLQGFENIIDPDQRDALNAFSAALYQPAYAALEAATSSDDSILKSRIERFLAVTARDKTVRAKLRADAEAFIELGGAATDNALSTDRYRAAFAVGVQDGGKPFFDKLLAAYTEIDDPVFAGVVPAALAATRDEALGKQVLALALNGELGPRETYGLVQGQMTGRATRAATWNWLEANYAEFVSQIPAQWPRRTPGLARSFCGTDGIDQLQALFTKVGDLAPGHERALAQTTERIALCAALKDAQKANLEAALKAL